MSDTRFLDKYGPWAIVTGASSGIGTEFATQLASKGLNLVLIARRKDRLDELSVKLSERHSIQCKVIELDLMQPNMIETIKAVTDGLEIGLLVNNAGMNVEGHFYRGNLERNLQMIELNVRAPFILAYHFCKLMADRGNGGIIFVASISAFQASPYLSHYGATKSYLLSLSESMNYEFKDKGVDVLALCPGMTESEMTKGVKDHPVVMKAEPVVKQALDGLGNKTFVVPGLFNKTLIWVGKRLLSRKGARDMNGAMLKRFLPGTKPKPKPTA